ncbi:hypothetical protein COV20_03850 [Candidatus Woesearchaeota archaeon CG10_big_fil_rev_8_21_14_0_10_45_16]|nr:MAG: hypothetical protein COV20_03850 [Candidatus Woesearchaeota archaeon CG10_big_fil_rev_8_21_14_0_10_45_16]
MSKIVLIGIDAATWTVIDPLLKDGKLPSISSLIENGVRAPLKSLQGYKSPALWTSIATGKTPEKHSILYFSNLYLGKTKSRNISTNPLINWPLRLKNQIHKDPFTTSRSGHFLNKAYVYSMLKYGRLLEKLKMGGNRLTTSTSLQEKTMWEMLSNEKVSCGVVGWLVTWPAQKIHGAMISEKAIEGLQKIYKNKFDLEEAKVSITFPEEINEEISSLKKKAEEISDQEIDGFFNNLSADEKQQIRKDIFDRKSRLSFFTHLYLSDLFSTEAGLHLKNKIDPDFLSVYLPGLDGIQHLFWQFHQPESFSFLPEDQTHVDKFKDMVNNYYIFLDSLISRMVDDEAVIILASDHGMEAISEKDFDKTAIRSGQHENSPDGILIMSGGPIKRGERLEKATILDVAPTVLYLLGKEVDINIEGKVLKDAFDPTHIENNPVRKKDYGKKKGGQESFYTSKEEKEVKDRLKALGYLD